MLLAWEARGRGRGTGGGNAGSLSNEGGRARNVPLAGG